MRGIRKAIAALLASMAARLLTDGWEGRADEGIAAADLAEARDVLRGRSNG